MYVEVIEEGPAVRVRLAARQIQALARANVEWQKRLGLSGFPFELRSTAPPFTDLRARRVAGFLKLDDLSIEVIPKYLPVPTGESRVALWKLLLYAHPSIDPADTASGLFDATSGLADILAEMFVGSARLAPLRGMPLRYEERSAHSGVLRGRLDWSRLDELLPFRGYLPILVDELTSSVPANQLLAWAARELEHAVSQLSLRLALRKWRSELPPGITEAIPPRFSTITVSEQFAYLRPALRIAVMLASSRQANFGEGKLELPGFLWKSASLFEGAVRRLFAESATVLGASVAKRSETFLLRDGQTLSVMTPDLRLSRNRRTWAIFDAKYKPLGAAPSPADSYQVVAAGRRLAVNQVGLIYPSSDTGVETASYDLPGAGPPMKLMTVRVGLGAFRSTGEINALRRRVTALLGEVMQNQERPAA